MKLLRLLQEGEFQRVGGNQTLKADVRVISATNQDLGSKVKNGAFREDLYYRLNVVPIKIPPLRDRREDIPRLVEHFVARFSKENRKPIEGVSREATDQLVKYDYPGNIRELENIVERAVVISRGPTLTVGDLPFGGRKPDEDNEETEGGGGALREALETLERRMVQKAIEEAGGNQSRAAESLGLSERMLRYKLKKYRLKSL